MHADPSPAASTAPVKACVVGTPVSLTTVDELLDLLDRRPAERALTVAFCNVHSVMTAHRHPAVAEVLARVDIAAPDGMPVVWALRRLAWAEQQRIYGPDLMETALRHGLERGWKHYFYGATPATLERLTDAAQRLAPGAQVVGAHAPPFRPLSPAEEDAVVADICASGAQLVWVGLGMPKQELWADRMRERLPGVALLSVGAAFDLLAGTVKQAPDWMQERGLEWAYRLAQEPRRLWRRYLSTNPAFVALALRQLVAARRGTAAASASADPRGG